ncbi:DUF4124 domain-containing protein [uncultured Thiohalocapsa sp.]|uniref:DUF4124 domain-containing protein n=1 Tax=uncultured Thiohalocapsa sp. TaxID=768990 RepID=UPI0025F8B6A7|nr:DUF4124 domain-containing protein [uncultured Thiohalocapsa sp.]
MSCCLLLACLLLGAAAETAAQALYRWVDDQGNIQYSDVIPPTEVEKGHTQLSPQGLRVRTVPPAKTPEEIQRERELERLRAQQQRMLEQQRADDRVLLNTFQSVDDLIMTRDGNLSDIDTMIQFKKGNIRRQQDWLMQLRAEAADLERKGEAVPPQLKERIDGTERSIEEALAAIVEREQQKQEIRRKFDRDLKRLRQLKNLPATPTPREAVATRPPVLKNLVECSDQMSCEQLWQRALSYVRRHATMPIESLGKDVAMTEAPKDRNDIALTVSRIWREDGRSASIFLDVQCRSYSPGQEESCRTDARAAVLDGFRSALERGEDARSSDDTAAVRVQPRAPASLSGG